MLAAVFLLVGLFPAAAFAQSSEKLTRYLPTSSQMVVGLNISKLSKSKYYKEALVWMRANASEEQVMKVLEDAKLDLSKDLDAIALSVPDTQPNKSQPERIFTAVVSGSFENKKLLAALKKGSDIKEGKKGKATIYSSADFEFGFPADGVLWVTAGPDTYKSQAFEAMLDKKKSIGADKLFKRLIADVNTSHGFWMVGDTSKISAQQAAGSPQPKSIGLSMDVTKGLDVNLFADLPSEDDAKSAVSQVEALKTQGGQTAMLSMFGAGPLVANLKTKQDGTKLRASTTMTTDEFDILIQRVTQLAKSQMQGGGTMPSQPVPGKGKTGQGKTGKDKTGGSSSSGADADFN
jgi:hypothetical protein